jgi:hypothetical protein
VKNEALFRFINILLESKLVELATQTGEQMKGRVKGIYQYPARQQAGRTGHPGWAIDEE